MGDNTQDTNMAGQAPAMPAADPNAPVSNPVDPAMQQPVQEPPMANEQQVDQPAVATETPAPEAPAAVPPTGDMPTENQGGAV